MISYILYICVVLFLAYLGYFFSGKYRYAKKFYISWEKFHQFFLSEMGYNRRPINEMLDKFHAEGDFSKFLLDYKKTHTVENKIECLSDEGNLFLSEYFSFLGRTDYTAQKEYFKANSKKLLDFREKSEQDAKRYTDLYVKLGFLLGLTLIILLF